MKSKSSPLKSFIQTLTLKNEFSKVFCAKVVWFLVVMAWLVHSNNLGPNV